MEKRTIEITIDTAKDWYRSNIECLKTLALQAFTEEELEEKEFEKIKSFEDALEKLGISIGDNKVYIDTLSKFPNSEHLIAIYKLDIIRKALNGSDFKPSLVDGKFYYPCIRFYKDYDIAVEVANDNCSLLCDKIKIDGTNYYLVGGDWSNGYSGLSNFYQDYGIANAGLGLLNCKSQEIAQHMSKYFAKEIFEALYLQNGNYKWLL
jgi:hypothetical protein